MKLVFLHGPPAAGKLTIARKLHARIPSRMMDNHATIDLARKVFDFGAAGFWELVAELRDVMLAAAAASDLRYLITTGCYIHPDDQPLVEAWDRILQNHDAQMLPVHLSAPTEALVARVGRADRAARGKLTSTEGLLEYLSRNDYAALPRPGCIKIDTSKLSPDAAVERIIHAFDMRPLDSQEKVDNTSTNT